MLFDPYLGGAGMASVGRTLGWIGIICSILFLILWGFMVFYGLSIMNAATVE